MTIKKRIIASTNGAFSSILKDNFLLKFPGIIKGDEIMVINGAIVSDLDMMFLESVLQEEISLCMMMRSARSGNFQIKSNK